jgi:hypothetical protein
MSNVKPRPSMINYGALPTGLNKKINRIEMYSTRRKWYELWKPKRVLHTLVLCDDAVYEIFPPEHKPHPPLFGEAEQGKQT